MKIDEKIIERLAQLIKKGNDTRTKSVHTQSGTLYDRENTFQFGTSSLSLIEKVFGKESEHFIRFNIEFNRFSSAHVNLYKHIDAMTGVLKAAKDDYENGYLFKTRTLIEAEIFSDILEQAEELLKKGHYQVSAVVVGCVLEDGLRKLCDKNNITFPKKTTIEPMNVELAKIGIYNQFIKDKVSSIGKLRNHAAHGEWTEFTEKDVEDMIRAVRRFMEDYFS